MGVQLTESLSTANASEDEENTWRGASPSLASLKTGVGMVWRAVVLWVGLLGLTSLAYWVN
jgi:hypothetical protein